MTPEEIRQRVDATHPRTLPDGSINAAHVADESTLRRRHGWPSYIDRLDGPGRFRLPPAPVDGACPACGKFVALALRTEPPQWACIDIDCVHGGGQPLPAVAGRNRS